MRFKFRSYQILCIVTVLAVTMLFSCQNDFSDVQKVGVLQNQPIGEAEDINLKYTEFAEDTVRLLANLISPKMFDYSNRNFGFSEFPDGVELKIYDENNNQTVITANYAIYYTDTDLIDLRGNVIIATHEKDTLFTEQMFYNEKLEWVFTNEPFTFKRTTGPIYGNGIDADRSLEKYEILEMQGSVPVNGGSPVKN
ncbi:LPS export ABC transporter periplasmic protein LptC [Winogradskyella sp. DF17]|uniref:LPS export ABC transporter periplasmic protein LptC n=1 Tax=Winogradskyella pelagia TaxID=2819984 RepID=A0ABS3SZ29_9FLAO|nr:LPS export ABC transporter periplasmic protein LptC [Winogradskyella sp. DF17]MBO3115724.1 LPS export ABC transporter periplasmic protein LptC [Winogradskyella sp. DF17]